MKKVLLSGLALILSVSCLVGCTNREMGTVGGAAVGGVVGNVVTGGSALGTAAGAVGGAVIGNQVTK